MKNKISVRVASDVDYEKLIAEIFINDEYFAAVSQEGGRDHLKVDFSSKLGCLQFDYDVVGEALSLAKKELLE